MHKKFNHRVAKQRLLKIVKGTRTTEILPFKECPADNKITDDKDKGFSANDLFSLFTANIIKDETIFVR